MKIKVLTAIIALAFTGVASAQCTVTTGCGQTATYPEGTSIRTQYSASTQEVIISNLDTGEELNRFSCNRAGGVSIQNCGSIATGSGGDNNNTGGNSDICDYLVAAPQAVKLLFGCN